MKNFLKIVSVYVGAFFLGQRACLAYIWLLFKYAFICIPNTGRHIRIWYSKSTISYTICIIRNISNYGGTCQILGAFGSPC